MSRKKIEVQENQDFIKNLKSEFLGRILGRDLTFSRLIYFYSAFNESKLLIS